jgi:hypothetical protein
VDGDSSFLQNASKYLPCYTAPSQDDSVGTSHNPTDNPYSFSQTILTPSARHPYSFSQTMLLLRSDKSLLPKPYGKAQIFIHYQPANQRSQQQRKHSQNVHRVARRLVTASGKKYKNAALWYCRHSHSVTTKLVTRPQ